MEIVKKAHEGQLYDGLPYWYHLREVALIAISNLHHLRKQEKFNYGKYDEYIIAAAWMHDIIEDARWTYNDVLQATNHVVAEIVYALTNEKGRTRKDRANDSYYRGIRETPGAQYIKLCDRLANMEYYIKYGSTMANKYKQELPDFILQVDPNKEYSYLTDKLKSL